LAPRRLIVNADDLGLTAAVNEGIFAAHQRGIVTSASLMVRQGAAPAAATELSAAPGLAVGLHLDLGQWDYAGGEWMLAYGRCDMQSPDAIEAECRSQLGLFRDLLGRDPTHLDSHQHVHMSEPTASVAAALAAELDVPLRGRTIRFEGGFYGQDGKGASYPQLVEPGALVVLMESLPAGLTEIGCHPAAGPVPSSSYDRERLLELATLCDPMVRRALEQARIELRTFAHLPEQPPRKRAGDE
jgi:chitin disaccharide deacetylase